MTKQIKADLALIFVTLGWGISFILTKNSLDFMAPLNFIAVRFITAFLISALVFYKKFKRMNKKTLIHGSIIGFVLFLGYLVQTIGLQYTTVSNSGFITGFYVVLVPILSTLILRKKPENAAIVGTILAFIGLALMSVKSGLKINIGDILTLIGAFGFALHIIVIDRYTKDGESILLGIIQIGVVGFLGLFGSMFEGGFMIPSKLELWGNILFLAIICTAGAFIVQTVAQRYTTPTHTA
jgi:drug/metabolite transporter (DMT)-like permease